MKSSPATAGEGFSYAGHAPADTVLSLRRDSWT